MPGQVSIRGPLQAYQITGSTITSDHCVMDYQNPYINIKTSDTTKSQYGIQPASTGVTPSVTSTYGYTANMSNDPASTATTSLGPTMEFSMFASVYTGNAAAKTIVRG